jgi:hypothetical protein
MEKQGLSPCLQERFICFTCPCSEPDESSPHVSTMLLKSISILSVYIRQDIVSSMIPAGKKRKIVGNV